MSKRSQLRFVQRGESEAERARRKSTWRIAQVYRHSGGYPESVLPSLAQLKGLQDETGTERDPAYVAANYFFLNKLEGMGLYGSRDVGFGGSLSADDVMATIEENVVFGIAALEQRYFLLGYGVEAPESAIHGDEEYLYVVELPARSPFEYPGDRTVTVSSNCSFPRWVGPAWGRLRAGDVAVRGIAFGSDLGPGRP